MIFDASTRATELPVGVLEELHRTLDDWFLIGAFARNVVVHMAAGLPRPSDTHDVDVAVAAVDDLAYRSIVAPLLKQGGGRIRHRVANFPVDVIGYGGVAPDDQFEDDATALDVTGLAEAAACAMTVRVSDALTIRCASLHAQVVLKIVAWQARGAYGSKDAQDLALLLDASHQGLYEDDVWSDGDAITACDHVPDLAGPFRVGTLIARDFSDRVVGRLGRQLECAALTELVDATTPEPRRRDLVRERLQALGRGLRHIRLEARS